VGNGGRSGGGTNTSGGTTVNGGAPSNGGTTVNGGAPSNGGATWTGGLPPLSVDGATLKDPNGKTIVLRGASLIDIGTLYYQASQDASGIKSSIDRILGAGLLPHVIRLPVYPRTCFNTGGSPFYSAVPFPVGPEATSGTHISLSEDEYFNNVLKPAVDYVTELGLYVIIDYHQIDDTDGQSATDATSFWQYLAGKFADYSNVIYEAYNEPIDLTTPWSTFKPRAQAWVDTIRAAAPNNLIIVPSMIYDQRPGDASESPLSGTNLMYTAHVYPGNWKSAFQEQVATASTRVPLFVSEWGYVLNGSDQNLGTSSSTWSSDFRTEVDNSGASWTAWVCDHSWLPNLFSDSSQTSLTDFGTFTKSWLSDTASSDWVQ